MRFYIPSIKGKKVSEFSYSDLADRLDSFRFVDLDEILGKESEYWDDVNLMEIDADYFNYDYIVDLVDYSNEIEGLTADNIEDLREEALESNPDATEEEIREYVTDQFDVYDLIHEYTFRMIEESFQWVEISAEDARQINMISSEPLVFQDYSRDRYFLSIGFYGISWEAVKFPLSDKGKEFICRHAGCINDTKEIDE